MSRKSLALPNISINNSLMFINLLMLCSNWAKAMFCLA
ncbi:hypothetical protein L289_2203 [Acinetobacter gerneri DSM 14967 = CIP 107464 = MTCC 9824]|nr:hypothetical protein L289_2203 [Acinetobacter gerneri DSM 14967 = CIP 107464 = MTCC 9824]